MDINNQYGALEIQKRLLVLLKDFHSFCVANNIKYSLDWGSLLGAVRHGGFIPWDDDLDIMVDRQNYNKIIENIRSDNKLMIDDGSPDTLWIKRIRFPKEENKDDSYPPTMDVFVMDYAPKGRIARKLKVILALFMQGMLKVSPDFKKGNLFYRICSYFTFYLGKLFSRNIKLRLYNAFVYSKSHSRDQKLTCYYEEFNCMGKYYRTDLLEKVILTKFEDTEVYIVNDYDECLCIQFGSEYMTPPQMSERSLKH